MIKTKVRYNFLDDVDYADGGYRGRTCLSGRSGQCRKKVFGSNSDRICFECKKLLNDTKDIYSHKEKYSRCYE